MTSGDTSRNIVGRIVADTFSGPRPSNTDRTRSAAAPTDPPTPGTETAPRTGDDGPAGGRPDRPGGPTGTASPIGRWLPAIGFVALATGIVVLGEVTVPLTTTADRTWILAGTDALALAALALAANILIGQTGLLSLGSAGFVLTGLFAGGIWAGDLGLGGIAALPFAFVVGGALGIGLALLCCHLRGFYLTVVTFAFGSLFLTISGVFPGLFARGSSSGTINTAELEPFARGNEFLGYYYLTAIGFALCAAAVWNLRRSRWGRALNAVRDSEIAARSSGIDSYWAKVGAFALSSALVALMGAIEATSPNVAEISTNSASSFESIRHVLAAFIGGIGGFAGPILGGFFLELGAQFSGQHLGETFRNNEDEIVTAIGLGVVLFYPGGLLDLFQRMGRRMGIVGNPTSLPLSSQLRPVEGTHGGNGGDPDLRPEEQSVLLEASGLTKDFGGLRALDRIDISVTEGTVHALIGPNGSGKSTLINVLTGFYPADQGTVRLGHVDITTEPTHRRAALGLARTFQNLQVWRNMSVLENVATGGHASGDGHPLASVLGLPSAQRQRRRSAEQALARLRMVGLADKADVTADSLPLGDLRRLEIARALMADPQVLMLDEPAAGMQASEVDELAHLVRTLRETGLTILLIEHHMDLVMELADVVSVLDYGQMIAEGDPGDVRADPRVIEAYLGTTA